MEMQINYPGGVLNIKEMSKVSISEHLEDGREGKFFIQAQKIDGSTVTFAEGIPTKKKATWLMFRFGAELNRAVESGVRAVEWSDVERPARWRGRA